MTEQQRVAHLVHLVRCGRERHPALASRMERALAIVLFRPITLDGAAWLVQSDGRPQVRYRVTAEACGCADFREQGGWCKHRLAVSLLQRLEADEAAELEELLTHFTTTSANPPPTALPHAAD